MIRIFDGNNHLRRRAEVDRNGQVISNFYHEVEANQRDLHIVCWDGKSSLKYRRGLYPEYKAKREPAGESFYEQLKLAKAILQMSHAIQVEMEGVEADDVIAHLCGRYQVGHLHSNDADLAALGVPMDRDPVPVPPQWLRLYKTLVGDPSDNIPGVKGFGKVAWEKLDDHELRQLESCMTGETDFDQVVAPMSAAVENWIVANLDKVRTFYKVVGFQPLKAEDVDAAMIGGKPNPTAVAELISEFEI